MGGQCSHVAASRRPGARAQSRTRLTDESTMRLATRYQAPERRSFFANCFPSASPETALARTGKNYSVKRLVLLIKLVPQEGFEPPTPSLRMMCSTS